MSIQRKVSIAFFALAAFFSGVMFTTVGANLFDAGDHIGSSSHAKDTGDTVVQLDPASPVLSLEDAFTTVAESVLPTVVQIRSERVEQTPNLNGTPFEFFFREQGPNQERRAQGLGSGVIARADGYIITNNHVIDGADALEVKLATGEIVDATVIGADQDSDLAVIKIEQEGLPTVSFGELDDVRIGQWVLAFGSPLSQDLDNTVTAGIVSAMGRTSTNLTQLNVFSAFIQTDAAINPGNSGGPLVNLNGELIGINSAILSRSGGNQGIGFAIPVDVVDNVVTQLIETGSVQRAFLGVTFNSVPPALAQAQNVSQGSAQIANVVEGSAADVAGLEEGDIITAVNGDELRNNNQLRTMIGNMRPGEEVTLTVVRGDDTLDISVLLGTRDDEALASFDSAPEPRRGSAEEEMESLGLQLQDLSPALLQQLGLEENVDGVLISGIDQSSAAFRESELREGDIITEIDKKPVADFDDFERIYDNVDEGETFLVRVLRNRGGQLMPFFTALTKP